MYAAQQDERFLEHTQQQHILYQQEQQILHQQIQVFEANKLALSLRQLLHHACIMLNYAGIYKS